MPTPEKHALLSASSAARWLHCTAAPRFEEQFPESTSEYAEEGRLSVNSSGADQSKSVLQQVSSVFADQRLKNIVRQNRPHNIHPCHNHIFTADRLFHQIARVQQQPKLRTFSALLDLNGQFPFFGRFPPKIRKKPRKQQADGGQYRKQPQWHMRICIALYVAEQIRMVAA